MCRGDRCCLYIQNHRLLTTDPLRTLCMWRLLGLWSLLDQRSRAGTIGRSILFVLEMK